jgi:hypothetical protein
MMEAGESMTRSSRYSTDLADRRALRRRRGGHLALGLLGKIVVAVMVLGGLQVASSQIELAPPGPASAAGGGDEEGYETLTQGPIHEAFANPADLEAAPTPVAPKQPPPDVPEEPPEYMPEGSLWIPGYWLWDEDRDEFIWVTGAARVPPPNQRWVPGYYVEADGGFQRVSGFWVETELQEVQYVETAPPQTLEVGPSSPAPTEEHFWVPGNWVYHDTGHRWQAGYWAPYQPDWIWVPARWVWTPAGFVYCSGFWDYRMGHRGCIFAPVYFNTTVYTQPNWVYRPWCVIPTNNLFIHLWIRPRWSCYYFGNYYGPQFVNRGFIPWANLTVVTRQRYVYDPFYTYARVHYRRQGVDFIGRVQGWHNHFDRHPDLRPARTWREQQTIVRTTRTTVETQLIARTVRDAARSSDMPVRLARLDERNHREIREHADRIREINSQRARVERSQVSARLPTARDDDDRGKGKAGSLVERAEKGGKGRDGGEQRGRGATKLTLPKADLSAVARAAPRGPDAVDRPGADRGKGKGPPPKPSPTAKTGGDRGQQVGRDDARPGASGKGRDVPGRDDTPGRDATSGREAGKAGAGGRTDDRIGDTAKGVPGRRDDDARDAGKQARDTAKSQPGKRGDDRSDLPGVGERPGGRPDLPGVGRGPDAGRPEVPKVDRPGKGADIPRVGQPDRDGPGRGGRPDVGTPNVTPRPTPKLELPGKGKAADTPRVGPRIDSPGKASDGPKAAPRIAPPQPGRDDSPRNLPRATPPTPRPDIPRANPPSDRGGGKGKNSDGPKVEARRPDFGRESPAPMPRVQPRVESRPMPRVEAPRETRPMPRVEVPRENRPAPRIEAPKGNSGRDRGGDAPRTSDRPQRSESSGSSDTAKSGKGKGKSRDDN